MTTVTRRYSIKRLLRDLPQYEEIRLLGDLQRAWRLDKRRAVNRLINLREGSTRKLSGEEVQAAANVLGVSMEEIMKPFAETTSRLVKV